MIAKLLVLGYSNIAQRRVLPAARAIGLARLDLACRSGLGQREPPVGLEQLFDDYERAIDDSDAQLVYVSTTNDRHAALASRALARGKHVIVDKPAALRLDDVLALADQAAAAGLCVAEANVWAHHPQVQAMLAAFAQAESAPRQVLASFSFPPLSPDNIRYRAELGGGALWDLGPYAVSPGRVLFGCAPTSARATILASEHGVDTAFCVELLYDGGRSLVGQFGFTSGYSNRLELLGPDVRVWVERVFTPPPDFESVVEVNVRGQARSLRSPPANSFALFLADVRDAITSGETSRLREAMIADHRVLDELRLSSGVRGTTP